MTPPTVLLADADLDSRTVYATILEHHGIRVLLAAEPAAALRLAREERPALVVAELFLPFLRGRPLAALLREDPRTARIPILGLTAVSHPFGVAPGQSACDGHLVKPCPPSRLLREVRRMLGAPAPPPSAAFESPLSAPADC